MGKNPSLKKYLHPCTPHSHELFREFFLRTSQPQQPELAKQIAEVLNRTGQSPAEEAGALATLARASGSELAAADFLAAQVEISEEDLAGVAGGFLIKSWESVKQEDGTYKRMQVVRDMSFHRE